ncbi:hypothetical protein COCON_G00198920 [Conger conger]|uniref:Fibronectin type-III domain-containing protein n=1 Tax=Conger conger TaxID=82655 RepID=A0A9Q1D2K1_CONCO|nr:hypothetical protein COCON_G00198920 [Conger conger]
MDFISHQHHCRRRLNVHLNELDPYVLLKAPWLCSGATENDEIVSRAIHKAFRNRVKEDPFSPYENSSLFVCNVEQARTEPQRAMPVPPEAPARARTAPPPGDGGEARSAVALQTRKPHRPPGPTACRPGFYKAFAGNIKCSKCPPHSFSYEEGSAFCNCEKGFYRAEKDPPTMACTRPPSPPRNVVFNINETSLFLEWSPPSDMGGRKDLTYNVLCKRCGGDPRQCELCGGDLRFIPRPQGLVNASVTVLDFTAHANYTFEIESFNGVSDMSSFPRPVTAITISTDQGGVQIGGLLRGLFAQVARVQTGAAGNAAASSPAALLPPARK